VNRLSRRRVWWGVAPLVVVAALLSTVLAWPAPRYTGRVLYLRLSLAWPGRGALALAWESQYWIDPARGRLVYAQGMSQPGGHPLAFDETPPSPPALPAWAVITLARRPDGQCAVVYTTLLDSTARGVPFVCADLLALTDVSTLKARMRDLTKRYGVPARSGSAAVRVALPGGTDPLPLIMDRYDTRFGYERLQPGSLVLDARTGLPLSTSVYWREGKTLVESVRRVDDVPPGALPGDFFDAPRLSLPDRAPALYQWLHATLPWHP
jgi:hypothetical protein